MDQDQQQQKQPTDNAAAQPPVVDEAPKGGKTKQLVGDAQGFNAQEEKLKPGNQPGLQPTPNSTPKADKGAESVPAPVLTPTEPGPLASPDEGSQVEKLSPIREAMLKQFELMEGKGVGMAEFDAVCSKETWEKEKAKEEAKRKEVEAKYVDDLAKWEAGGKKGPKPQKGIVPVYTTCIDTMRAITNAAWKSSGLAVKRLPGKNYDMFSFGSLSRQEGSKIGAWVEGKPKSGESPQPGDMFMLEKAGASIDKLGQESGSHQWMYADKIKKMEAELEKLNAASAAVDEAKSAAAAAKAKDVEAKLSKVKGDYEAAKTALATKKTELAAKLAERVQGGAKLEFSHVGFFKGKEDEMKDGQKTGREIWHTFDGGQSGIAKAIGGQGAKSGKRYYDPETNLISGEASQGGAVRWLGGWISLDKMVAGPKEEKPKDGAAKK